MTFGASVIPPNRFFCGGRGVLWSTHTHDRIAQRASVPPFLQPFIQPHSLAGMGSWGSPRRKRTMKYVVPRNSTVGREWQWTNWPALISTAWSQLGATMARLPPGSTVTATSRTDVPHSWTTGMQTEGELAPTVVDTVPGGQGTQVVDAISELQEPAGHEEQAVEPVSANEPGVHGRQSERLAFVSFDADPAGHILHIAFGPSV